MTHECHMIVTWMSAIPKRRVFHIFAHIWRDLQFLFWIFVKFSGVFMSRYDFKWRPLSSSSAHLNKFEKGNTGEFLRRLYFDRPIWAEFLDVFTLEVKTEVGKMKAMEINHDSWGLGRKIFKWFLVSPGIISHVTWLMSKMDGPSLSDLESN